MPMLRRRNPDVHVKVHLKALEGIVLANTSRWPSSSASHAPSRPPPPSMHIARNFFLFEILFFGFYLLSSLVAQGMKLAVTLLAAEEFYGDGEQKPRRPATARRCRRGAPRGRGRGVPRFVQPMTLLAAGCSIMGNFFLLVSMVEAIQLKFSLVSCGILVLLAVGATFPLSGLVGGGLLFYRSTVAYALTHYLP
ncbi:hypothetical protein PVAP13_3NG177571 [Panicum virgatum]|uniref:Uncharacterized protein n=1 Tax=Panicum virgatum TaxID=38727 RepID=A0A8T0U4N6_PANVG|nr:hypothetical protein PVAP13_3NG177571 [Panicum virgatum]